MDVRYTPMEPILPTPRNKRKRPRPVRRLACLVLSAALFGGVAAGAF